MRRLELCLLVALALIPCSTAVGAGDADDVIVSTLQNGLTVAVKEYHAVPGVSIRFYIKVGGALEEEHLGYGLSHYCEHLVSGCSTTTHDEEELDRTIQLIGAQKNAYTTHDHTCYHAYCATEHWATALEVLAEHVMHCAMDPQELEREKGVITREINMGDDEPFRVVYKLLMHTLYPNSAMGIPTIGYRDNFVTLTPEQVVSFYERYYVPNNTLVVVVGHVAAEEALAKVTELMGDWPRGSLFRTPLVEEPPQTALRKVSKELPGEVGYLRVAWPGVLLTDPDLYALDLLAAVMGHGTSSRLYRTLKEERQLVFDISAYSSTPAIAPGPFVVTAMVAADKVNEAAAAVIEQINLMKDHLVPAADLERAKNQVIADYDFAQQSCEDMAATLGGDLLRTGNPSFSSQYTARITNVTAEQLRDVSRRYLQPARTTIVCLGGEPLDSAKVRTTTALGELAVRETTLPNGLRLVTRLNPNVDVISIEALFTGGNRYETEETNGLFTLLSGLLRKGTTHHTTSEIAQLVESRGGSIETGSGKDSFWLRLNLLARDLEFGMKLMGELLTQSTFPATELDKEKIALVARLQDQENDWQGEAFTFFTATYFGGHPYHLNHLGNKEAVSRISRADIVRAREAYLRAGSAVVAVAGNASQRDVESSAQRYLVSLPAGTCPAPPAAVMPRHAGENRAIKVNDKGQVTICVGYPAPSFGHVDEYPMRLLDAITSGINLPQGWLQDALRGRNDLVYFVHLVPIVYKEAGAMMVITQCQPDLVDTVLSLIRGEMARASRGEFTEEDIAAAKGEYLTVVDNDTQTTDAQAHRLASFELLGLGSDMAFTFADRVRGTTLADVQRIARDYLQGEVITMAGPLGQESGTPDSGGGNGAPRVTR